MSDEEQDEEDNCFNKISKHSSKAFRKASQAMEQEREEVKKGERKPYRWQNPGYNRTLYQ
jgi:hypothetical protein